MEVPAPSPAPVQTPPAQPNKKKPLDEAARAKVAARAAVRKLARQASSAGSADEFFQTVENLKAKREGRDPRNMSPDAPKPVDPLDVPIRKGGPTPRMIEQCGPAVSAALDVVQAITHGTRYEVLHEPMPLVSGATKRAIIQESGASLLAELTHGEIPDIPPGWAFVIAVGVSFGPPAAAHANEVFGPKVRAWWNAKTAPAQPPVEVEGAEEQQTEPAKVTKFERKKKEA